MPPSLFKYATSELSQDAAVCWLIAWADPKHAEADPALHQLGRSLITELFSVAGVEPPASIDRVDVFRQVERADIVVEVGTSHAIVIEDKVYTRQHSGQLDRYREKLRKRYPHRSLALIYLKIGDQSSYDAVTEKGWRPFRRPELIRVLETAEGSTENAIYVDFLRHLRGIEEDVQSFRSLPPEKWSWRAWMGFFMALQNHVSGQWDYVPNPSGGFMGFWWSMGPDGHPYLQLENDLVPERGTRILAAKVEVRDANLRRAIRDGWCRHITARLSDLGFVRPARLGTGRWMTVAVCASYLRTRPDGLIDMDETVRFLHEVGAAVAALEPPEGLPHA